MGILGLGFREDVTVAPTATPPWKVISSAVALAAVVAMLIEGSDRLRLLNLLNTRCFECTPPSFEIIALMLFVTGSVGLIAVALAILLHFLRSKSNALYWETAAWFLLTLGILLRPIVISPDGYAHLSLRTAFVAAVSALVCLPLVMKALNRIAPKPGLAHVATPLALGFLLDLARFSAATFVPTLEWLQ